MRLYLINPSNPLVSIVNTSESRWNRYRVWKPLSLMVLSGLTPPDWGVTIIDENLAVPNYAAMPQPDAFPGDWKYYTLTFPVARYRHLAVDQAVDEMISCGRIFYSLPRLAWRVWRSFWHRRQPLIALVGNLSYRSNLLVDRRAYTRFQRPHRHAFHPNPTSV